MDIFANSQRESTLRYFWLLWHNEVGRQIKDEFKKHVKLSNEVAHGNRKIKY